MANARLQAGVLARVDELAASRRRIVEAADLQRRRLEQELRGGAQARLAQVAGLLDDASHEVERPPASELRALAADLEEARDELDELAQGIHPRLLTDAGLPAALEAMAARTLVPTTLSVAPVRLPQAIEAAVWFVCSESLANVAKHAPAARASVEVAVRNGTVAVTVADDGGGGADAGRGSGLRGLADRVEALGGRLVVDSPTGRGTKLLATLPADGVGPKAS